MLTGGHAKIKPVVYRSYLKIRIFGQDQDEAEDQLADILKVCRGLETRAQRRYRAKRLF